MAAAYDPKWPSRPVPIVRQAACLRFAAVDHALGYWSYLGRYADNPAFKLPDIWTWFDIPEALKDAADTLSLVAELAALRGDVQLRLDLQAAIDSEKARSVEVDRGR